MDTAIGGGREDMSHNLQESKISREIRPSVGDRAVKVQPYNFIYLPKLVAVAGMHKRQDADQVCGKCPEEFIFEIEMHPEQDVSGYRLC